MTETIAEHSSRSVALTKVKCRRFVTFIELVKIAPGAALCSAGGRAYRTKIEIFQSGSYSNDYSVTKGGLGKRTQLTPTTTNRGREMQ